ncbi:hypothetical protein PS2_031180 [Malus domestica]
MSYATGDAQLPVLGHSRVESLSKGRLGSCDAQQEMVLNCRYMLLLLESFRVTRTKLAFECVLLVLSSSENFTSARVYAFIVARLDWAE